MSCEYSTHGPNMTPLLILCRFRVRFKSFIEQYELRELHFHSLMRTKELEVQYHQARYEREKKSAEGESSKARHLQAQVQAFTKTETELRNQLNVYVDKFKQVRVAHIRIRTHEPVNEHKLTARG
jgi:hypothetical protein